MNGVVALRDGGRIAWETRGAAGAPPVLLIRPLGGSMSSWSIFADALAKRTRVIAFDLRGTGRSSPAPWRATTRSMAEDARAVLDALGVARAHAYGISLGGMIAMWLAIDSPARVSRLVLASTMAKPILLPSRGLLPALGLLVGARPSPRSAAALLSAAARHDATRDLARIEADTLILAGARDRLVTRASQRILVERIPRARLEIVAGAGHDISADAPEHVAKLVIDHLVT